MFDLKIDFSDILAIAKMGDIVQSEADKLGSMTSQAAFQHAIDLAESRLHTRKDKFISALSVGKDDNTYLLILDSSAIWIDQGMKQFSMLPGLLSSPKAKQGKNGKYITIPFNKNGNVTPAQNNLVQTIKSKLNEKNVPFDQIENNSDGTPKEGLLHSFNINDAPINQSPNAQGHGKFGQPVQGNTGIPFLQGVRVYQKKVSMPGGGSSVKRFVGTFRTASETQSSGKWIHPGVPPTNIFADTEQWIKDKLSTEWVAKVLDNIMAKLK